MQNGMSNVSRNPLANPIHLLHKKIAPTANFTKQALPETPTIPETEAGSDLERQQEVEPEITDTAGKDASLDEFSEFLDGLGDEELASLLENRDTTDTETEALADFLQEQLDNSLEKDSGFIVIDELDTTQTSGWIELGDRRLSDVIDIKGLGNGDNVIIIDGTGTLIE